MDAIVIAAKGEIHGGRRPCGSIPLVQTERVSIHELIDPRLVGEAPPIFMALIETAEIAADRHGSRSKTQLG